VAFFPRTDAGQFTINMKVPTGTRIEVTEQYVKKVEDLIHRHDVSPHDFKMVVSNIGVVDDFTALYTDNAGEYTSTVQVALNDDHETSSFEYMARVQDGPSPRSSRMCAPFSRAARWWTRSSTRACPRPSTCRSAART
jgi:HAE1 family hydrophobic/amphiphilic exporter-1